MKNTYTYEYCYKILGQNPDCNWNELRKSYKKLIHKWHPDRFTDASKEKKAADEKIKSINIAYNQLHKYYRENNSLPPVETVESHQQNKHQTQTRQQTKFRQREDSRKPEKNKSEDQQPSYKTRPQTASRTSVKRSFYTAAISLLSLGAFYYIYTGHMPPSAESNIEHINKSNQHKISEEHIPSEPDKQQNFALKSERQVKVKYGREGKYFTYGDSIGKVIGAQGVPDRTEGDIWYYGESEVHFKQGLVTHWVRKAGEPLKARLNFETRATQKPVQSLNHNH